MAKRTVLSAIVMALLAGTVCLAASTGAPQININTASAQELQMLPRIGPALAQRIVEFRTANGAFKAPEELVRVKGIGEKSFALLQPYVAISGTTTLKEKVRVPRPKPVDGSETK